MAGVLALTAPVAAQQGCGDRSEIMARLADKYGETRQSMALDASGAMVETFAAPGGSWTMLRTTPGGVTCLLMVGQGWTLAPMPVGDPA